jgi:hypothetical protein
MYTCTNYFCNKKPFNDPLELAESIHIVYTEGTYLEMAIFMEYYDKVPE